MPPPSQLFEFLIDGPLQIRCPKAGKVYHQYVIGAKGLASILLSLSRKFSIPNGSWVWP
jgi:hypothetical protein